VLKHRDLNPPRTTKDTRTRSAPRLREVHCVYPRAIGSSHELPERNCGERIPDSSVAKAATLLAQECSAGFLFHHCLRTYVLGRKAGRLLDLKVDDELLYVACILHDLGLTSRFEGRERFEVDGADAARAFCIEQAMTAERADKVWDAVALHSTVGIAARNGAEATLVQIGRVRMLGFGEELLGFGEIRRVMNEVPREDFGARFLDVILSLADRKPVASAWTLVAEIGQQYHGVNCRCPSYRELFPRWVERIEGTASAHRIAVLTKDR
jgi:hypothetical protein